MRATEISRRNVLPRAAAVTGLATACVFGAAGIADAAPAPAHATTLSPASLEPLTDLAAQRVLVSDEVAAAKFGTDKPIDDPVREQQELAEVRTRSVELGIDPDSAVAFFQDQIAASKVVQRGLYARWTAHPKLRPTHRPDLVTEVRPKLDALTTEILQQLQATQSIRRPTPGCRVDLLLSRVYVEVTRPLDHLHRQALRVALPSVCG
jgi:chorismate mutase